MSIDKEFLCEEFGLDYDEYTSDTTLNDLNEFDFISFDEAKLKVFNFFNKYQNQITLEDIESIFSTLDYHLFKQIEEYVNFERKENYFDLEVFPL